MNRQFAEKIVGALRDELFADASFTDVFLDNPFPVLKIGQLPIMIHCINLDWQKLETLPLGFFMLKTAQAEQRGFQLIHLWEDVFYQQKELTISRLRTILGQNKTLYGRQCTVTRIDKKTADRFLNNHHLQQTASARYKYGLFHLGALVAVATFSAGKTFDKKSTGYRSHELVRFASLQGISIAGGLSKLIRAFVGEVRPNDIMTYADRDWSAGKSYDKTGFLFEAATGPQGFYIRRDEMIRHYPQRLYASFADEFSGSSFDNQDQFLRSKGYFRIYNSGNLKFRLTL